MTITDKLKSYPLIKKWGVFFSIILDPWVLILLILTISTCIIQTSISDPTKHIELITITTTLIAIITGVLGGVIANKWHQMAETSVLVARGKTAVRSLKLINSNVVNLEKSTAVHINKIEEENSEYKLIVNSYEEIMATCHIVQEEISSSIDNWLDIIPDAKEFKKSIGILSELKRQIELLNTEIETIQETLDKEKESGEEVKKSLTQELLNEKELKRERMQFELNSKEYLLNNSVFAGIGRNSVQISGGTNDDSFIYTNCIECGKLFFNGIGKYSHKCSGCNEKTPSSVQVGKT